MARFLDDKIDHVLIVIYYSWTSSLTQPPKDSTTKNHTTTKLQRKNSTTLHNHQTYYSTICIQHYMVIFVLFRVTVLFCQNSPGRPVSAKDLSSPDLTLFGAAHRWRAMGARARTFRSRLGSESCSTRRGGSYH